MPAVQQPIPSETYGIDYFEGRTSNYVNGYTWEQFGDLFTMTARLLIWLFPDATRYLDFGCATGLLVRALREAGKDAWGVDHSPYCLEHAEAEAKPYLAADVRAFWSRPQGYFDVVTVFETLEHLTVAQITDTLSALRRFAGQALVATIPCVDMIDRRAWTLAEQEITHVSLYPRAFWIEQFKEAGFEYGMWQQLVERYVALNPLVQQMGWNLFILGV